MDGTPGRNTYIVEARRPIRRVQSIGEGMYALQIPTAQSPAITGSPVLSRPLILQSMQQSSRFQSHRFSPYQAERRSRSNSDNSSAIVMMNTVIPVQATVIPTLILTPSPTKATATSGGVTCSTTHTATGSTATVVSSASSDRRKVACSNCGIAADESNTCKRCRKIQKPDPTHVLAGKRSRLKGETSSPARNGLPSSRFYNGASTSDTNDFMRYLKQANNNITIRKPNTCQRKRRNMEQLKAAEKSESDCITISSDSEEEDVPDSQASTPVSTPTVNSEFSFSKSRYHSADEIPAKRIKSDSQSSTTDSTDDTSGSPAMRFSSSCLLSDPSAPPSNPFAFTDDSLSKATLNLRVDSARLGQMKLIPDGCCRVSHQNMTMTAHAVAIDADVILTVPWQGVVTCDMCVDPREPCMYFTLNPSFIPNIRESLRMEKGKHPYYDPGGSDDERYFIFYLDSPHHTASKQCNLDLLWRKIDLIRRKLKRPMSFLRKISYSESALRQGLAASSDSSPDGIVSPEPTVKRPSSVMSQLGKIATDLTQDRNATLSTSHAKVKETSERSALTRRQLRAEESTDNSDTDDLKLAFSGPRIKLFVYPPPPSIGGISVTNEDQFCLNKGEFLNDVIIDFYLKYISNQLLSPVDRARTHIFSCFFYERLMQKPAKKNKDMSPSEQRHSQVKKWTRNVDIFSKDFIFVPINEASHWYLAVICFASLAGTDVDAQIRDALMKKGIGQSQPPMTALPASMQYLCNYGESSAHNTYEVKGQKVKDAEVSVGAKKVNEAGGGNTGTTGSEYSTDSKDNFSAGSAVKDQKVRCEGSAASESLKMTVLENSEGFEETKKQKTDPANEKRKLITITLPRFSPRIVSSTSTKNSDMQKVDPSSGSPISKCASEQYKNVPRSASQIELCDKMSPVPEKCSEIKHQEVSSTHLVAACTGTRLSHVKAAASNDLSSEDEEKLKAEIAVFQKTEDAFPSILSPIHETITQPADTSVYGDSTKDIPKKRDSTIAYCGDGTDNSGTEQHFKTDGSSLCINKHSNTSNQFFSSDGTSAAGNGETKNAEEMINVGQKSSRPHPPQGGSTYEMVCNGNEDFPAENTGVMDREGENSQTQPPQTGSTYEISLIPNRPPFTLPQDLKLKCRISPKKIQLKLHRVNDGNTNFKPCTESSMRDTKTESHEDIATLTVSNFRSLAITAENSNEQKDASMDPTHFEHCTNATKHGPITPGEACKPEKAANFELGSGATDRGGAMLSNATQCDAEDSKSELEIDSNSVANPNHGARNSETDFEHCASPAKREEIAKNLCKCPDDGEDGRTSNMRLKPSGANDCAPNHDQISDPETLTSPSRPGCETIVLSSDNDERKQTEKKRAATGTNNEVSESCKNPETGVNQPQTIENDPQTSQELMKLFSSRVAEKSVYKKPCIVVFDSLRGPSRSKTASNLREYLSMEWITRKHKTRGEKVFNKDTIKMSSANVPQQDNYSDCGVFLLHYVEKFFSNPLTNFSTPIRDLANWFDPTECKTKREEIKNIIDALHEDWIARQAR